MAENPGYSAFSIYLILVGGGLLAIFRPRVAIYVATLAFVAVNSQRATFTRTQLFGPYLNLYDSFLLMMLLATAITLRRKRRRPNFPRPLLLVVAVVVIGTFTSALRTSFAYDVLREVRWAYNFPIVFFVFANVIETESQTKPLFLCLFAGSLLAATQHVNLVNSRSEILFNEFGEIAPYAVANSTRTIAFVTAGIFFLAAAPHLQIPFRNTFGRLVFIIGLALIGVSALLTQVRSIWIALMATIVILGLVLRRFPRSIVLLVPLTLLALLLLSYTFSWLDPVGLVTHRFATLNEQLSSETEGRIWQLRFETEAWWGGNWFVGNGLGFVRDPSFRAMIGSNYDLAAWGHIGHLAYLSRLGLLGLFVYSVYLPIWSLRRGLVVWRKSTSTWTRALIVVGLATVLFGWLVAFMSSSYLEIGAAIPGIFYGAIAGLYYVVAARGKQTPRLRHPSTLMKTVAPQISPRSWPRGR